MIILGIETSCDETALALIEKRLDQQGQPECRVLASLVHSQADLHSAYGGVYPSLAKREHGHNLVPLLHQLFLKASEAGWPETENKESIEKQVLADLAKNFQDTIDMNRSEVSPQNPELFETFAAAHFLKEKIWPIELIAVTEGPGLEPALWVGINFARLLSELWQCPVVPINHMEGHIVGSLWSDKIRATTWQKLAVPEWPAIALLISGGHTELVTVNSPGQYQIIGQTRDDAVGEAFDKAARLLGLPYPGGPEVERLAAQVSYKDFFAYPRSMSGSLELSFSGLKTAVLYDAIKRGWYDIERKLFLKGDDAAIKAQIASSLLVCIAETFTQKVRQALKQYPEARAVTFVGGVACNTYLKQVLEHCAREQGVTFFAPSPQYATDNAAMVAYVAQHKAHTDQFDTLALDIAF